MRKKFIVNLINADLEFKSIKELLEISINFVDPVKCVHLAERSTRTLKEQIRCIMHRLPLNCIPKGTILRAMFDCNSNLNYLLQQNSSAEDASPLTITTNTPKIDYNRLTLQFGDYVETHKDNHYQTSSLNICSAPAIALNPKCNTMSS